MSRAAGRFGAWAVMVAMGFGAAVAVAQTTDGPDTHSLCLPSGPPPAAGYQSYEEAIRTRGQQVIAGVPAYLWRHGCGPTAAGMVVGYWDGQGFPLLIPGDASAQTDAVNQAIASGNGSGTHYSDYSLPLDASPDPIQPDKSSLGGAHSPHHCLGDFMRTSWSSVNMYYGWSWSSYVPVALQDYVNVYVRDAYAASYVATSWDRVWGDFTWSDLVEEVSNHRPLVFLVDTDGDGGTDHFVTVIGFRDTAGYEEYACYDTWSTGVRWERFREMSPGNAWGIYGATLFAITAISYSQGDLNCDGAVDGRDVGPFVLAVVDPSGYAAAYPACQLSNADFGCDGGAGVEDISGFVDCLLNGNCPSCSPPGMVLIPAGEFLMGNSFDPGEGYSNELPRHAVYVDAFYMDTYEVTNQQYCDALNWAKNQGNLITVTSGVVYKYNSGTSYPYCDTTTSSSYSRITWNGTTFGVTSGKADHPMVMVSWYGSVAYANWRSGMQGKPLCYDLSTWTCNFGSGYRLPTEAEWEKAARGGTPGHRFPWSDQDTIQHARCNYYSTSGYSYDTSPTRDSHPCWGTGGLPCTSPVGFFDGSLRYKADFNWPGSPTSYQTANGVNGYGLYDMAGNVLEWCNDWYGSTYYSGSPYSNPHGPTSGTARVLRGGGGWNDTARFCRCANRSYDFHGPFFRVNNGGIRLALVS